MLKRALRHPAVRQAGARVLGAYLRFALRTTRWKLEGSIERFVTGEPTIFAFWHDRLPPVTALFLHAVRARAAAGQPPGRMKVLVSRNRDGRLIGDIIRGFGVEPIHGSRAKDGAQKGGAAALRALVTVLAEGGHVGITPDGPRGPRRVAAPGVAHLAALSGVPVVPCAAHSTRLRLLPTWDRMALPLPFGRGVLVCGAPIAVPREGWEATLPTIAGALTDAAARAEALCR